MRTLIVAAALTCAVSARAAEPLPDSALAPLAGAVVTDGGAMVVTGGPFDRRETFEFLKLPEGGHALVSLITAADGAYRVQGVYRYTPAWEAISAAGVGLYEGEAVRIRLERPAGASEAAITVRRGEVVERMEAACNPDCFLNMSPSALAMFVMTRHMPDAIDEPRIFRWAAQDLNRVRTLSGGVAELVLRGTATHRRADGSEVDIRHYTFVETLPTGDGGSFQVYFNLWTDSAHRPIKFQTGEPGSGFEAIGVREGWETLAVGLKRLPQLPAAR